MRLIEFIVVCLLVYVIILIAKGQPAIIVDHCTNKTSGYNILRQNNETCGFIKK